MKAPEGSVRSHEESPRFPSLDSRAITRRMGLLCRRPVKSKWKWNWILPLTYNRPFPLFSERMPEVSAALKLVLETFLCGDVAEETHWLLRTRSHVLISDKSDSQGLEREVNSVDRYSSPVVGCHAELIARTFSVLA